MVDEYPRLRSGKYDFANFLSFFLLFFAIMLCFFLKRYDSKFGESNIQLLSFLFFTSFFFIGQNYEVKGFCLIVFLYQLFLSTLFYLYFWKHQYILDNNLDWMCYDTWAQSAWTSGNFIEYVKTIKLIAYGFDDWGYPIFLYLPYKLGGNTFFSLLFSTFFKCLIFTISAWYFYKLSLFFCNKYLSKQVFLLYSLNASFIFFNAMNIKESVFSSICVFTVYNMIAYSRNRKFLSFFSFLAGLFITVFFRPYISFFIFVTFLTVTVFKKFVRRHFYSIWILVAIMGVVTFNILKKYIGVIAFVLDQSIGGSGGFSMPVLIITGMIFPVPAFSQLKTADNFLVCSYTSFSIVLSFFAVFELVEIFRLKKEELYPLVFLTFFIKLFVIIGCRVNEYRFQTPLSFVYFILMVLGFEDLRLKGIKLWGVKHIFDYSVISSFFIILAVGITFMYNM